METSEKKRIKAMVEGIMSDLKREAHIILMKKTVLSKDIASHMLEAIIDGKIKNVKIDFSDLIK
jgi:hypothetical protein